MPAPRSPSRGGGPSRGGPSRGPGGPSRGGPGGRGGDRRERPGGRGRGGPRGDRGGRRERSADDMEQKILDLARVTRVTAGGKRMRFRACVAVGDQKGRVGVGLAKSGDVSGAIAKATTRAKKEMMTVPIVGESIPHDILVKYKAATVLLKPAPKGTGIIAGGVVRLILNVAGVPNIAAKMLGSSNKISNANATIEALRALRLQKKS